MGALGVGTDLLAAPTGITGCNVGLGGLMTTRLAIGFGIEEMVTPARMLLFNLAFSDSGLGSIGLVLLFASFAAAASSSMVLSFLGTLIESNSECPGIWSII